MSRRAGALDRNATCVAEGATQGKKIPAEFGGETFGGQRDETAPN
jgi:hypothetical protein